MEAVARDITTASGGRGTPLSERNFVPVALHGFGDPANAYAHSMAWFNGCLYAGVARYCYHANRPYDLQNSFRAFPVQLRRFNWELDWRARIWRYDPEARNWQNVHVSPTCMGNKGFEVPRHLGFRDMAVFRGDSDPEPSLYTVSWGSHMGLGPFVLRCRDGATFEEVGAGQRQYFGSQTLRALAVFKGRLFTIPTGRDSGIDGAHDFQAGVVLESTDPTHGGWRVASPPFFGDPGNVMLFDMAVFNGFLYVGTMNPYEGFQVWKTNGEGEPPYAWHRVLSHGAYRGRRNEGTCSFCAFGDSLYIGTGIYAGGYDRIYDVGPGAPELLRLHADDSWELLVGEPRQTPVGLKVPASGLGPGFNNPFAGYIWRMCAHDGWLYAGTLVWSPWLPFANVDLWPEQIRKIAAALPLETIVEKFGGFDLWRSRNGRQWQPVTRDGFGNPFNVGVRSMVSTPYGLFVSSVNLFGPEVAVERAAGWRYELNPRGGLEVWQGSLEPPGRSTTIESEPLRPLDSRKNCAAFGPRRKPADLLDEFYNGSAWRHVGFWEEKTKSAAEACENLVGHLVSFLRPEMESNLRRIISPLEMEAYARDQLAGQKKETTGQQAEPLVVHDLSHRSWVTSRYLTTLFPNWRITSRVGSRDELAHGRHHHPQGAFEVDGRFLAGAGTGSSDLCICVEGLSRWGGRKKMLRKMHSLLKPGGRLLCTDMFCEEEKKQPGIEDYQRLLAAAGFEDIEVFDLTRPCGTAFRKAYLKFLLLQETGATATDAALDAFKQAVPGAGEVIAGYFLLRASRKQRSATKGIFSTW